MPDSFEGGAPRIARISAVVTAVAFVPIASGNQTVPLGLPFQFRNRGKMRVRYEISQS